MSIRIDRREFVKAALLAPAVLPLKAFAKQPARPSPSPSDAGSRLSQVESLPMGKIANVAFSRLMLGGNLISGYAHSRELTYVAQLSKRYNTEAKIQETFELAETHGINVMNSYVMDDNEPLQNHWKRGGKMKWIAQVRINPNGDFLQIKRAVDQGATAVHVTGDTGEKLLREGRFEKIGQMVELIKSQKCIAGVAAHALSVIVESEKAKFGADFYVKTLHTHDYPTAPRAGENDDLGRYDNSWCKDPEEVVDFMFGVQQPWIAFKVMAAGAIPPRRAFQYAFDSGADFVLAGMFDWQIEEDVKIVKQVLGDLKRNRPWRG